MNKKTLISALILALGLGSLALPGTAAARDYGRDGDRQEHRRDRHDNDRGRYERRDHRRDRYEHRRHDYGHHRGSHFWFGFPFVRYGHYDYGHHHGGHHNPDRIIRIQPRW